METLDDSTIDKAKGKNGNADKPKFEDGVGDKFNFFDREVEVL